MLAHSCSSATPDTRALWARSCTLGALVLFGHLTRKQVARPSAVHMVHAPQGTLRRGGSQPPLTSDQMDVDTHRRAHRRKCQHTQTHTQARACTHTHKHKHTRNTHRHRCIQTLRRARLLTFARPRLLDAAQLRAVHVLQVLGGRRHSLQQRAAVRAAQQAADLHAASHARTDAHMRAAALCAATHARTHTLICVQLTRTQQATNAHALECS